MRKYNSSYSKERLEDALDLVENNWIQLQVTGGSPNQLVNVSIGDSYIVTNLISQYTQWKGVNCTGQITGSGFDNMKYRNYNLMRLTSYENSSSKTNSKALYNFLSKQNHIYYFSAIADGIRANENHYTSSYYTNINRYCIAIEDDTSRIVTSEIKNDLGVHKLSCIGQITSSNRHYFSMYSNLDQSNAGGSVYFGYMGAADLTEDLGIITMPTGDELEQLQQWCDSNLNFIDGSKYYQNLQIFKTWDEDVKIEPIVLEEIFDDTGKCLFNLPGYGLYTPNVITDLPNQGFASNYYSTIEVDTVKRYTLEVPSYDYTYPKTGSTALTITFRYSAIDALQFIGYLVIKDGYVQTISDVELSDIVTGDAGKVYFYVYNKVPGRENKYSAYKDDEAVKSGEAVWNSDIEGYRAEWADTSTTWSNRLNNGDYVYFLVPNENYWNIP